MLLGCINFPICQTIHGEAKPDADFVDSKVVALGSQNWSGDGTLRNRDATLIIHDPEIARYYEQIFIHDWTTLANDKVVDVSHTASAAGRDTTAGTKRPRKGARRE